MCSQGDGGRFTGFSSEIGAKLRDWAVGQVWGSCYSWAAVSSNDSKTLYLTASLLLLYHDLSIQQCTPS